MESAASRAHASAVVLLVLSAGLGGCASPGSPGAPRAGHAAVKCPVDTSRFRDVGPAYVDGQSGLLWRHCAAGQNIDMKTKQCQGAILATEKFRVARDYVESLRRRMNGIRMPTIDEIAALAEARCGTRPFGSTPHADYGGAPIWTTTPAGQGTLYQYDPAGGGKVAADMENAPGVILLIIDPPAPPTRPR